MDNQDRQVYDFGQCNRAMSGFTFRNFRMRRAVIFRRFMPGSKQAFGQPADYVVILGMHHDHGAMAAGRRQYVQDFPIVEFEEVIGHVNLE